MSDITETMTVKNGQAAVKTVTVAGKLSPKTSATDTIALVETSDGKQAALKVYNINGGGGGGGDYDAEIEALENAVSVLTTSVELSTEIGQTTTVLLDELLTLDVDGRPDYKAPGATVYAENGVTGIIDTIDASAQTAVVKTVSISTGGSAGGFPNYISSDNSIIFSPEGLDITGYGPILGRNKIAIVANPWEPGIERFVSGDTSDVIAIGVLSNFIGTGSVSLSPVNGGAYGRCSIAVGYGMQTDSNAEGAIQIGCPVTGMSSSKNMDANTFKVSNRNGNFEMMDANGYVPADRLPTILEIEEF